MHIEETSETKYALFVNSNKEEVQTNSDNNVVIKMTKDENDEKTEGEKDLDTSIKKQKTNLQKLQLALNSAVNLAKCKKYFWRICMIIFFILLGVLFLTLFLIGFGYFMKMMSYIIDYLNLRPNSYKCPPCDELNSI